MRIPILVALLAAPLAALAAESPAPTPLPTPTTEPLHMAVMDPLYKKLACECIKGFAQRDYEALGVFLSARLGRPVEIVPCESLVDANKRCGDHVELLVGKQSVIKSQAAKLNVPLRPLAMLSGTDGKTTLTGLFIVRNEDPAKTLADLKGRKMLFGLPDADEKYSAALASLKAAEVPVPAEPETRTACNHAAVDVANKKADAAVISSYAIRLAEGCGAVEKGSLRVVGETAPVPFVTVFATGRLAAKEDAAIVAALLEVSKDEALKVKLESRDGFLPMPVKREGCLGWGDWRGPRRDGISDGVPAQLPAKPRFAWRKKTTGPSMAGVAVSLPYVVVADKSSNGDEDIWRCLDAQTGDERWVFQYAAPGKMDYTNAPRATPVICGDKVYLLGAFGRLECLELKTGNSLWSRDLLADFGGKPLSWGFCARPLVDGERLIVGTASPDAALVALNRQTGETLWEAPGNPAGYGGMVAGVFGGRRQIVGCDSKSLGGWNPETGERLWTMESDSLNVPTPIDLGGRLLVANEGFGARIYAFNSDGTLCDEPQASNDAFKPNATSPVTVNGLLFGFANETLSCLDLEKKLATNWSSSRKGADGWGDYASFIGGNGRVLATSVSGWLTLFEADGGGCRQVASLQVFDGAKPEVWSHPALVDSRLYLRSANEVVCLLLGEE